MQKQIDDFKWKKNGNLLLKDIERVLGNYGSCNVVHLSKSRFAILDRSKLRFLVVPASSYRLSSQWRNWLKRGFVVFVGHFSYSYYIFNARTLEPLTEETIIDVEADAFLNGKCDYFMIENKNYKKAIFNSKGQQITDWYDNIDKYGLVMGQSDYFRVKKGDKYAIFDKDGKQITDWYDDIDSYSLLRGESDYYVATKDGQDAIFHRDGKQISEWFDLILYGLVEGESDYYIAKKYGKTAIFDKDGNQISDWFYRIESDGLVAGRSDYYIAEEYFNDGRKQAVFDKNRNQITDWHSRIRFGGLVSGRSPYCIAIEEEREGRIIYIYKAGSKKVMGPFKDIRLSNAGNDWFGFIDDPSEDEIVVTMLDGSYKEITKEEADKFFDQEEYKEV